jgi:hypothetical protein
MMAVVGVGLGCPEPVPPPDLLARLDSETLSYPDFEAFLKQNTAAEMAVLGSESLSALLDQCLDERLLARLAQDDLGMDPAVGIRARVEALLAADVNRVDDRLIFRYYESHRSAYNRPERVHLRQLLITDRAIAHEVQDLWSSGVAYSAMLERLAEDPSVHVGEEGEFSWQALPTAFAEPLFSLDDGEVSEVLEADYGFHVFQVVRQMPAEVVPLSTVADEIREELEEQHRRRELQRLVAEARERYNVRVFERNLPFNYVGKYGSNEIESSR